MWGIKALLIKSLLHCIDITDDHFSLVEKGREEKMEEMEFIKISLCLSTFLEPGTCVKTTLILGGCNLGIHSHRMDCPCNLKWPISQFYERHVRFTMDPFKPLFIFLNWFYIKVTCRCESSENGGNWQNSTYQDINYMFHMNTRRMV